MAKRTIIHVMAAKTGGWDVREQGNKTPLSTHKTKTDAVKAGRALARAGGLGQLKIFKKDGKIQTEYTYGQDPKRHKG